MMDGTTNPMRTALRTDFQCATGLRLLNVYLERERVIITARISTVRLDLVPASRASDGNTPPRLVRRAMIRAIDIMKALLFSRSFGVMDGRYSIRI